VSSKANEKDRQIVGDSRASLPKIPAPISDREVYERQMAGLPPEQREITQELAVYADTCQYFETHGMDVPPHICRAVVEVSTLPLNERAARMRQINQELMEYLHSVSDDPKFRM
jgi:hypothetical protein